MTDEQIQQLAEDKAEIYAESFRYVVGGGSWRDELKKHFKAGYTEGQKDAPKWVNIADVKSLPSGCVLAESKDGGLLRGSLLYNSAYNEVICETSDEILYNVYRYLDEGGNQ